MPKYTIGTLLKITEQEQKADNGTFEIIEHFPLPDGNDYYTYKRIGKDCSLLDRRSWFTRRGNFMNRLDKIATIINQ